MNLNEQTAIVSGSAGDIGAAIVRELERHGARVAGGDVRGEGYRVDVSDPEQVRGWFDDVERDLGLPTLIVPNAAIVTLSSVLEITPEDWRRHLDVNLSGAFYMAQEGAKRLVKAGRPGRIVFLGSWVAHYPDPTITPYCVSKAGLRMVMKEMAKELARYDILVNEVAPGFVDAGVSAQVMREDPARRQRALDRVPVRRLITAEEVAKQVAYLCDPENRHMTGSVLLMDGGNSL